MFTKAELKTFFFGEGDDTGYKYYEVDTPPQGFKISDASKYCTSDCYCSMYQNVVVITTKGTCSIGTEVTE